MDALSEFVITQVGPHHWDKGVYVNIYHDHHEMIWCRYTSWNLCCWVSGPEVYVLYLVLFIWNTEIQTGFRHVSEGIHDRGASLAFLWTPTKYFTSRKMPGDPRLESWHATVRQLRKSGRLAKCWGSSEPSSTNWPLTTSAASWKGCHGLKSTRRRRWRLSSASSLTRRWWSRDTAPPTQKCATNYWGWVALGNLLLGNSWMSCYGGL